MERRGCQVEEGTSLYEAVLMEITDDFGDRMAAIESDQRRVCPKWADLLMGLMEDLARLECGLVDMKIEALRLEAVGMWPAVPSESWEARNGGDAVYLRLVFPVRKGPGGQRKVYVGRDPAKVAAARRKTANRLRWEELDRAIAKLEMLLRSVEARLAVERSQLARYELPLGTPAIPRGVPVTNGEGEGDGQADSLSEG